MERTFTVEYRSELADDVMDALLAEAAVDLERRLLSNAFVNYARVDLKSGSPDAQDALQGDDSPEEGSQAQ